MIFPSWLGFIFCFAFCSCYASHLMSSSAFHLYVFQNLHPFGFSRLSPLSVRSPDLSRAPVAPLRPCFHVRVLKRSRNGTRLVKWPWYTTGRPPVKFRVIWSSFDTPTINCITAKASFGLQPNTPPKQPNNPSKSLPCSPSSDHDRVGENYTSFGVSLLPLPTNMSSPSKSVSKP